MGKAKPKKAAAVLPIVCGSVAFSLGAAATETRTHSWTIYVRGVNGVDISSVISKVTFQLHPSCEIPVVEQTTFPFETTQTGWGEFQAQIHLSFADASLGKVMLSHHLQLFPDGQTAASATNGGKPVVKEVYDELIFSGVSPEFQAKLDALHLQPTPSNSLSSHWLTFSETEDLAAIAKAHAYIKERLQKTKDEVTQLDFQIQNAKAKAALPVAGEPAHPSVESSATATGTTITAGPSSAMELEPDAQNL